MVRRSVVVLLGALILALIAACGGEDPTATPAGPTATSAPITDRVAEFKAASEAKGMRFLTHDEIVAGAQREGKLIVVPGLDDTNFGNIKTAFEETYPYLELEMQIVSGTAAGERFNFGMLSGNTEVDVLEASADDWELYAENDLLIPFDYESMALAGELAINPEAILHTQAGQLPFFGSGIDVIAYNTDMISEEDAPKNWDDCIDPKWKGLVATDTSTGLQDLNGAWTEEEILTYTKAMKDNDVIFVRGITATLVRLLAGEFPIMCPTNYHGALRQLIADPDAPMKLVLPDPLNINPREQEGIYAGAKHPHAGLLWMEFISRPDVQLDILAPNDPGKTSFMIEGTVPYNLLQDFDGEVHLCDAKCTQLGVPIAVKIVVDSWGFPHVGATPD
jgi:iron(III) transport system substrate-binding protein